MNALYMVGRMLFGGYFLYNGVNHFLQQEAMAGYAGSKNVPSPQLAVQGTGALLVLAGLSLLFDLKPRIGAGLTAAFLLGVTPMMHRFWEAEDPAARQADQVNFTKNLGLLGAALMLTQVHNRPSDAEVDSSVRALAVG
jgi:uncharacterized membrane protein YphA (DoxX/SURF4 family)